VQFIAKVVKWPQAEKISEKRKEPNASVKNYKEQRLDLSKAAAEPR